MLDAAAALGADWAVTLDGDERLNTGGQDVRAALAPSTAEVLGISEVTGLPDKVRFIKLPAQGHWRGPVHPVFGNDDHGIVGIPGLFVSVKPLTAEWVQAKAERDVRLLSDYSARHPNESRWQLLLGNALALTGRHAETVSAYCHGAELTGDDEASAWALFRASDSLRSLGRPGDAVSTAAAGLAHHAGMAELPWMAGLASWEAGRSDQASYWARLAISLGAFVGGAAAGPRRGPVYHPALWEGPYDVLRFALRRLGDDSGADGAERQFVLARNERAKHAKR